MLQSTDYELIIFFALLLFHRAIAINGRFPLGEVSCQSLANFLRWLQTSFPVTPLIPRSSLENSAAAKGL
jgi:hypothetical protein